MTWDTLTKILVGCIIVILPIDAFIIWQNGNALAGDRVAYFWWGWGFINAVVALAFYSYLIVEWLESRNR